MRALRFVSRASLQIVLLVAGFAHLDLLHAQSSGEDLKTVNAEVVRLHEAGRYSEALPLAVNAVALAERLHGPDHPNVGTALNNLGLLYRALERNAEAEPV